MMFQTMNETADEAASSPVGAEKYATNHANISRFQSLYCWFSARRTCHQKVAELVLVKENKEGELLILAVMLGMNRILSIVPMPLLPHQRPHHQGLFLQLQPILQGVVGFRQGLLLQLWFQLQWLCCYLLLASGS